MGRAIGNLATSRGSDTIEKLSSGCTLLFSLGIFLIKPIFLAVEILDRLIQVSPSNVETFHKAKFI